MRVHAWHLTFHDPAKNSRKFYWVFESESGVTRHWGRIGSIGQNSFDAMSHEEARIFARKQVYAKLDKGYQLEEEGTFEFDYEFNHIDEGTTGNDLARSFRIQANDGSLVSTSADHLGEVARFTESVQELIDNIKRSNQPPEDLLVVLNGLRREYDAVKDELDSAASALEIAQLSLMQRV